MTSINGLQVTHNPFKGPIVLGYQLNTLIEYQMRLYREAHHENRIIAENNLALQVITKLRC